MYHVNSTFYFIIKHTSLKKISDKNYTIYIYRKNFQFSIITLASIVSGFGKKRLVAISLLVIIMLSSIANAAPPQLKLRHAGKHEPGGTHRNKSRNSLTLKNNQISKNDKEVSYKNQTNLIVTYLNNNLNHFKKGRRELNLLNSTSGTPKWVPRVNFIEIIERLANLPKINMRVSIYLFIYMLDTNEKPITLFNTY